jgi:TolB-like protein
MDELYRAVSDIVLFLELVDAVTGNRLWGEQYNRKQAELIAMQNDIALDISQKLRDSTIRGRRSKISLRTTPQIQKHTSFT